MSREGYWTAAAGPPQAGGMIVTTTPTGTIGRQLLDLLLARSDEPIRVVARDPGRLPAGLAGRVEVVAGSHGDPKVIDTALEGADALFWLTPPPWRAADLTDAMEGFARPAAEAVVRHRVSHVVGISNLGRGVAGDAGVVTHGLAVDDQFAATGAAHRALVLPGFMDNLLRDVATIRDDGCFRAAQDRDLKTPHCATADVAEVAAGLLLDRTWTGQAQRAVLGPADQSMDELAAIVSDVLGRRVDYVQVTLDELRADLLARGASPAMADGMVAMMAAKNAGLDNAEPRTAQNTTPTSFRQWCEDVLKPAVDRGQGAGAEHRANVR